MCWLSKSIDEGFLQNRVSDLFNKCIILEGIIFKILMILMYALVFPLIINSLIIISNINIHNWTKLINIKLNIYLEPFNSLDGCKWCPLNRIRTLSTKEGGRVGDFSYPPPSSLKYSKRQIKSSATRDWVYQPTSKYELNIEQCEIILRKVKP